MSIRSLYILVWLFCCVPLNLYAQSRKKNSSKLEFQHIYNGLSSNTITNIVQDDDGFIWVGTTRGLNRYNGIDFKVYEQSSQKNSIPNNLIEDLKVDNDGKLWVATSKALIRYNKDFQTFESWPNKENKLGDFSFSYVNSLEVDQNNNLWIGTNKGLIKLEENRVDYKIYNEAKSKTLETINIKVDKVLQKDVNQFWIVTSKGLFLLDLNKNEFTEVVLTDKDFHIFEITKDKDGSLWVATLYQGLFLVKQNNLTKEFLVKQFMNEENSKASLVCNNVLSLLNDKNNILWVGTEEGLQFFNREDSTFTLFSKNIYTKSALQNNSIWEIYQDKKGRLWIGTFNQGIELYDPNFKKLSLVQRDGYNGLKGNTVSSFSQINDSLFLIGFDEEGIALWNRQQNSFSDLTNQSLQSKSIKKIFKSSKGEIWIGGWGSSLQKYNLYEKQFTTALDSSDIESHGFKNIYDIDEDSDGNLWLAAFGKGVFVYRNKDLKFIDGSSINPFIRCIYVDSKDRVWAGSLNGITLITKQNSGGYQVNTYNSDNSTLSNEVINSITEDNRGRIWIATDNKLNIWNEKRNIFETLGKEEGLSSNAIMSVVEDSSRSLWIATNKGLNAIKLYENDSINIKHYTIEDGLPGHNFVFNATYKSNKNEIFIGGYKGFSYFKPEELLDNPILPKVYLNSFKLFNKEVDIGIESNILPKHINEIKHIVLNDEQNVFTLGFEGLTFTHPESNQYAYRLDGLETDWNYVGNKKSATYTNLDPGTYVFKVKAANNDGTWNPEIKELIIKVLPAWWETTWFITISFFSICLIATVAVKMYINRIKQQKEKELNQFILKSKIESATQANIFHKSKIELMSNISHEFRTPLSLILAPLEKFIQQKEVPSEYYLSLIYKNALTLKSLVNQVLDFKKIESKELDFEPTYGDIILMTNQVFDLFKPLANQNRIEYNIQSDRTSLFALFDRNKYESILTNLLSNAFKFTRVGSIKLITKYKNIKVDNVEFIIKVIDTGTGIHPSDIPFIFNRMYHNQVSLNNELYESTGIGLALVKKFTEMHNGVVEVESNINRGTTFTIKMNLTIPNDNHVNLSPALISDDIKTEYEEKSLLLVEDNTDVRNFLKTELNKYFKIYEANSGISGYHKAISVIPDFIISDISMPLMDGVQMCEKLKAERLTSHIPIILLTAYGSHIHQKKGLEAGADDYLIKPFSSEILILKIKNLLESKRKLQKKYQQGLSTPNLSKEILNKDELFLEKAKEIVLKNLKNNSFDAIQFSSEMSVSQAHLYRKLKALTDESITGFVKVIRLNLAKKIIESSKNISVKETAFEVGFSDQRYFSKCFKDQFGISPSEFKKNMD